MRTRQACRSFSMPPRQVTKSRVALRCWTAPGSSVRARTRSSAWRRRIFSKPSSRRLPKKKTSRGPCQEAAARKRRYRKCGRGGTARCCLGHDEFQLPAPREALGHHQRRAAQVRRLVRHRARRNEENARCGQGGAPAKSARGGATAVHEPRREARRVFQDQAVHKHHRAGGSAQRPRGRQGLREGAARPNPRARTRLRSRCKVLTQDWRRRR
mmetsp:Transcript_43941/g.81254  ORF Transcript_43941/g.81254 Transcript_43941/m.81254 type:complete len:213 (-) Transcript_43941:716-1354(-)